MSAPINNIASYGSGIPETTRIPPVQAVASAPSPKAGAPESPFGPDYILETTATPQVQPQPTDAKAKPESKPDAPTHALKKTVAGVVPFASASGPSADLASLPPLQPIGTEALTELSLNKWMQPSNKPGMV